MKKVKVHFVEILVPLIRRHGDHLFEVPIVFGRQFNPLPMRDRPQNSRVDSGS
jgi:hypothetical protein